MAICFKNLLTFSSFKPRPFQ